ncbi:MAG: sodium:calcium antiporter [Candidatus Hodarchaeota archaeon]
MLELFLWILLFLIGYLIIFFAADVFLDNLRDICIIYGISPFIIGALIIGIDPEESIASIIAAISGLPYIAVGNVIGNSIIALTISFAIPAFFYKISFKPTTQFYFILLYSCISLLLIGTLINFGLFIVGIIVILVYFIYFFMNIKNLSQESAVESIPRENSIQNDNQVHELREKSKFRKIVLIIIGFIFIFFGGELLIFSSEQIIVLTNIPETFFGFVILAFVTNVEELTLVIKSIRKKSVEIGLGGMIGKIFWNLTITFGISAIIIVNFAISLIVFWNWLILLTLILYFNWISKKKSMKWNDGIALTTILAIFLIVNFTISLK